MITDIEGTELKVGDPVFYARKNPYHANGILIRTEVSGITDRGFVRLGKYTSTSPSEQLVKIK